jgi:hypothetical protein
VGAHPTQSGAPSPPPFSALDSASLFLMSLAISFMARVFSLRSSFVDAITGVEDRLHHGLCDSICELLSDLLRALGIDTLERRSLSITHVLIVALGALLPAVSLRSCLARVCALASRCRLLKLDPALQTLLRSRSRWRLWR